VPDLTSPNLRGIDHFAFDPTTVEKPWGSELLWAQTERYAGKILFVRAGESLSLQFHNVKDESWYVLEGRAHLEIGRKGDPILDEVVIAAGEAYHFPPGTVHRVKGIEDTRILEVSTPELDDVVRLEDRYGRQGTSEP
jgi:mannose-6-phosphate isomerase